MLYITFLKKMFVLRSNIAVSLVTAPLFRYRYHWYMHLPVVMLRFVDTSRFPIYKNAYTAAIV